MAHVHNMQLQKDGVQRTLPGVFQEVRQQIEQQFDDHRAAINENTTEIQAVFDYLREIEGKIDALGQRVEHMLLSEKPAAPKEVAVTTMERDIFMALYMEEVPLSYGEIALKCNIPVSCVPDGLTSLSAKGIPFVRTFYGEKLFVKLDPKFKELQAKENIVNLSLESFI